MTLQELEKELVDLSPQERLRLAKWLLDSVLQTEDRANKKNPLLQVAGIFNGGSGNSAEQIEEILAYEIDKKSGLSNR